MFTNRNLRIQNNSEKLFQQVHPIQNNAFPGINFNNKSILETLIENFPLSHCINADNQDFKSDEIIIEIEKFIFDKINSDNEIEVLEKILDNGEIITDETNQKKSIFFQIKKNLKEMESKKILPLNSDETLQKFSKLFKPSEVSKIILVYLFRLYDVYQSNNDLKSKYKTIENIKNFIFSDLRIININKNFDFEKPHNLQMQSNFLEEENEELEPKSELSIELLKSMSPEKIIKYYISDEININSEILKFINPNYLFKYFEINKISPKLFARFFENDYGDDFFLKSLFLYSAGKKNTNFEMDKFIINIIQVFSDKNQFYNSKELIYNLKNKIPSFLTLNQIENIIDTLPQIKNNFIDKNYWIDLQINKKFQDDIENSSCIEELFDIYSNILKFLKEKNIKENIYDIYIALINGILIVLGSKLYKFDLNLFLDFLNFPLLSDNLYFILIKSIDPAERESIIKQSQLKFNEDFLNGKFYLNSYIHIKDLNDALYNHLFYFFFKSNEKYERFENFFPKSFLDNAYEKAQIYKGEKEFSQEFENKINTNLQFDIQSNITKRQKIYQMINETKLDIIRLNKNRHNIDDEVEIFLEIKNIQNLMLKVYEINTENYYYTNKKTLDSGINLEGLIPSYEEIYIYNERPEILVERSFKIDKIPQRRGLYVIEFIGKDLSSRVVVKKGGLKLITKPQSKGLNLFIVDEENKICKKKIKEKIEVNEENEKNIKIEEKEEKNIEDKNGIWFQDNFYEADINGLIIIPYQKSTPEKQVSRDTCIISNSGFSEIATLTVECENYTLKGFFFTEDETLIMGNTAKFIAKPFLFLNNYESKAYFLKNIKITANISKSINGELIPSNKTFEKITLNENFEYIFELQIPTKVTSIDLLFEADVYNNSNQGFDNLKFSQNFNLETNLNLSVLPTNVTKKILAENTKKVFLQKINQSEYSLFVLGKNGEAVKNAVVLIKLFHRHLNYSKLQIDNDSNLQSFKRSNRFDESNSNQTKTNLLNRIVLRTDISGEIKLGNLRDFKILLTYLVVDDEKNPSNTEYEYWNLENEQIYNLPKRIDKIENQELILPLNKRDLNFDENIILYQEFKNGEFFRFCNENFEVLDLNSSEFSTKSDLYLRKILKIYNLKRGKYKLILPYENHVIDIFIHEGKYWEINSIIISEKNSFIYENNEILNLPVLEKLKINLKDQSMKIKVNNCENLKNFKIIEENEGNQANNKEEKLNRGEKNNKNKIRLQILAYNYLKNESFIYNEQYTEAIKNKINQSEIKISNWENIILASRKLNEEIQYILERKNYEKFMGNTLEKPSLLMKKRFIQKTTNTELKMEKGTEYDRQNINISSYDRVRVKQIEEGPLNLNPFFIQGKEIFSPQKNKDNCLNRFSNFKNFLLESAKFIIDVPINSGEEKEIKIPDINKYSHLQIICLDSSIDGTNFTSFEELIPLKILEDENIKVQDLKFKDLTLKKCLDLNEFHTELRTTDLIYTNDEYIIEDIFTNNFKIIDSLKKICDFHTLSKEKSNSEMIKKAQEFSFLFKFDELPIDKQKEKISKYFSNEFNFYIFMKYRKIFDELILPLIRQKIDKKFIDFFLLNDESNISRFAKPSKYNILNLFEKCLMIKYLSLKDKNLAKKLCVGLEYQKNQIQFKKLFDLVIHSKSNDSTLDDLIQHTDEMVNFSEGTQNNLFGFADHSNNINKHTNNNNNNENTNFSGGLTFTNFSNNLPFIQNQIQPFQQIPQLNQIQPLQQMQQMQHFQQTQNLSNNIGNLFGFSNQNTQNSMTFSFSNANNLFSNSLSQQIPSISQTQQNQIPSLFGGFSNTNTSNYSNQNNIQSFQQAQAPQQSINFANLFSNANAFGCNMNFANNLNAANTNGYEFNNNFSDAQYLKVSRKSNVKDLKNHFQNYQRSEVSEYCETQKIGFSNLTNTQFWVDYANYIADNQTDKGFLSKFIILPTNDFVSLFLTCAVLDLPAFSIDHVYIRDLDKKFSLKIKASSNFIIFSKKLTISEKKINENLIITQKTSLMNCTKQKNSKETEEEYLINQTYCHETNIINTSYERLTFDLLIQIPERAIPVLDSDYKKVLNISLVNNIMTIYSYFYFPKEGVFNQYGPSASFEGIVISKAENKIYDVKLKLSKVNKVNIQNILECGDKNDILEYFRNCQRIDKNEIKKIFWILKDKKFYEEIIFIFNEKFYFDEEVWAFSFYHKDENLIKEFLENFQMMKKLLGPKFNSFLLNIEELDCCDMDLFNHKEYFPIINNRIIYMRQKSSLDRIENNKFRDCYADYLIDIFNKDKLTNKDYLRFAYYLILQDRINESVLVFNKIKNKFSYESKQEFDSFEIQYDYINAYLDFTEGYPEFKKAREIFQKYTDCCLKSWKELFEEVKDQLDEYDSYFNNNQASVFDAILKQEKSEKNKKKNHLLKEPKLSMKLDNKTVKITYSNLEKIYIKFYFIDLEILFTSSPFFKKESGNLSFVNPNFEKLLEVENSTKEKEIFYSIPEEYHMNNFIIEISSNTKKTFKTYSSNELEINILGSLGEIKLLDKKSKPIMMAYVKCFAKLKDGKVIFYKDGFTDLRGKFNYLYNNISAIKDIDLFSIFVSHEELGSVIKLAYPPNKLERNKDIVEDQTDYENLRNLRNNLKQRSKMNQY